jgi:SSS family solute:Na+ symporter
VTVGRIATVVAVVVGIGTAFIAAGFSNIMNYIQALFSVFNAPLFATFIVGMFWKRMTPGAGFWGLIAGTAGAALAHYGNSWGWFDLGSDQAAAFWGAIAAFVADAIVSVGVTFVTTPKPVAELDGLVYGMAIVDEDVPESEKVWYRKPGTLAIGALGLTAILSFIFA